jgi:hypothetical protein
VSSQFIALGGLPWRSQGVDRNLNNSKLLTRANVRDHLRIRISPQFIFCFSYLHLWLR